MGLSPGRLYTTGLSVGNEKDVLAELAQASRPVGEDTPKNAPLFRWWRSSSIT